MKNCPLCEPGHLAPLGRAILTKTDGGVTEVLLFTCVECRSVQLEQPSVTTIQIKSEREAQGRPMIVHVGDQEHGQPLCGIDPQGTLDAVASPDPDGYVAATCPDCLRLWDGPSLERPPADSAPDTDAEIERSIQIIETELGKIGKSLTPENKENFRELINAWGLDAREEILFQHVAGTDWAKIKRAELEEEASLWERTNVTKYVNSHAAMQETRRVFEGYMARTRGVAIDLSPYATNPMHLDSWLRGWRMADEDLTTHETPDPDLLDRLREAQDAIFDATVRAPHNWIRIGLPTDGTGVTTAEAQAKVEEFAKLFGCPPTTVWDDRAVWEAR